MHLKNGAVLQGGRYRIEKTLGQGGFGITYLAIQSGLNRKVAIKEFFMKEHCNRDAETSHVSVPSIGSRELVERFKAKFIKEAQMISEYRHPNIVNIYDVFEENGTAYYVMEYHDGGSLSSLDLPLSVDEASGYIRQIASALSVLHENKTMHLDIKPSNVLLDKDGKVVLIDFGVSKHCDDAGKPTTSTPGGISYGYAPIEQYSQSTLEFSPTIDIYALGATLYKLLTGVTPPDASLLVGKPSLLVIPSSMPASIASLICQSMSPGMDSRPQNINEFLEILDSAMKTIVPTRKDEPIDPDQVVIQPDILEAEPVVDSSDDATMLENNAVHDADKLSSLKNHAWVDLGLPSGLKWATCNVGALSPEEYGNYYAWGETTTKKRYTVNNSDSYGSSDSKWKNIGGKSSYDAARANWGGDWRLPTKVEFEELREYCTWEWTTLNGHNGYKVIGPNGNSIFLPAAGCRNGADESNVGSGGYYWSSTPYEGHTDLACYLYFDEDFHNVHWNRRYYGLSVRPVLE